MKNIVKYRKEGAAFAKIKKTPEKRSFEAHTVQPVHPGELKEFLFELVVQFHRWITICLYYKQQNGGLSTWREKKSIIWGWISERIR